MFTWIGNIIAVIKALYSLWNYTKKFLEEQRLLQAKKQQEERQKAADALKQCKTEKECDDASDSLHSTSH